MNIYFILMSYSYLYIRFSSFYELCIIHLWNKKVKTAYLIIYFHHSFLYTSHTFHSLRIDCKTSMTNSQKSPTESWCTHVGHGKLPSRLCGMRKKEAITAYICTLWIGDFRRLAQFIASLENHLGKHMFFSWKTLQDLWCKKLNFKNIFQYL